MIPTAAGSRVTVPPTFDRLIDLAGNLWWTWIPEARELWQRVSPPNWVRSPNPITVMQTMPPEAWEILEANDSFVQSVRV